MSDAITFCADEEWNDAIFSGFEWENDGKDLRLHLAHGSKPIVGLLCRWVSDLRVDLTWRTAPQHGEKAAPRRGGSLLSISLTSTRVNNHRWSVYLDFGSDGHIEFECENAMTLGCDPVSPDDADGRGPRKPSEPCP